MSTATTGPYIPFLPPFVARVPGLGWAGLGLGLSLFAIPSSGYDSRRHLHLDNHVRFRLITTTTTTRPRHPILDGQTPPRLGIFSGRGGKGTSCGMAWRPSGMVLLICVSRLLLHPPSGTWHGSVVGAVVVVVVRPVQCVQCAQWRALLVCMPSPNPSPASPFRLFRARVSLLCLGSLPPSEGQGSNAASVVPPMAGSR